jgi:3-oxoacyl-[acyl-carrier-protein] synthase II
VPVAIAASAILTCHGDGPATFEALLESRSGIEPLRNPDAERLNVTRGFHVDDGPEAVAFRATGWLTAVVREAVRAAGLDGGGRVMALVGTGLRELRSAELWAAGNLALDPHDLHFGRAVRAPVSGVDSVVTLANACSAGGHALALGQDLVELGEADAVIVAAADAMTTSMLAMMGRVVDTPTEAVRPFDRGRTGVLLGEGAAAAVLVPDHTRPALGRVLATGLACDASHETAPSSDGIERAMRDALERARRRPADVDVVVAHGTGTPLNDPVELEAITAVLGADEHRPAVTGVKGAVGHTSGAAALVNLDVALRCLASGSVPPTVGLTDPISTGVRLVAGAPVDVPARLVQSNAFGFGGVNAVTLVEAV